MKTGLFAISWFLPENRVHKILHRNVNQEDTYMQEVSMASRRFRLQFETNFFNIYIIPSYTFRQPKIMTWCWAPYFFRYSSLCYRGSCLCLHVFITAGMSKTTTTCAPLLATLLMRLYMAAVAVITTVDQAMCIGIAPTAGAMSMTGYTVMELYVQMLMSTATLNK